MRPYKKVTVTSIAREAGVSIATVSRALNDMPKVDKHVQLKIKKIAAGLGYDRYRKQQQASLDSHNLQFIVVLMGRAGSHLTDPIQVGIDDALKQQQYFQLRYLIDELSDMKNAAEKEIFIEKIISEKCVAGILSVFIDLSTVALSKLAYHGIPAVLLNNNNDSAKCVFIDNYNAAYQAVTRFIKLDRRQIGCIMPREHIAQVWKDRLMGYRQALIDHGLPFLPERVQHEDDFIIRHAGIMTKLLIEKEPRTDAILFGGDLQAYGGLKALQECGKTIPRDIAVIGFDDMISNTMITPSLSSVKQPMYDMGKAGCAMLLRAIAHHDFSPEKKRLDAELILRKSCLPDYKEEPWF